MRALAAHPWLRRILLVPWHCSGVHDRTCAMILLAAVHSWITRLTLSLLRSVATLEDRKSTRLNSSHVEISYAVFCLKKKKRKCGTAPTGQISLCQHGFNLFCSCISPPPGLPSLALTARPHIFSVISPHTFPTIQSPR